MISINDALVQSTSLLTQAGLPEPRLDAQVLLGHILQIERSTLYAYPERLLDEEQEQQFRRLIERRQQGEPVAYLVGHKEFFGLDFLVDKRVLIPRPETELLVEAALRSVRSMLSLGRIPVVADIGTGSGIIPITLAVQEPRLPILYATDISPDALDVTRLNCQRHQVEERVSLLRGDLLAPLPASVDILTANLPYVGTDEMAVLAPDVWAYEPHLALFSGPQGLHLLQRFLTEATEALKLGKLRPHAVLLVEIGYQHREALTHLLSRLWPRAEVIVEKDYTGWDRLLTIQT